VHFHLPSAQSSADKAPIRVSLVAANHMDCEALAKLIDANAALNLVSASADAELGLTCCHQYHPQIMVVDPKCGANMVARTVEMVVEREIQHALILDDRVREGLVTAILPFFQVSYLTRHLSSQFLGQAITRIVWQGERVFDPAIAQRVVRTSRGWQLKQIDGQPSVAALTSRELEILRLLARGQTVRDCARHLKLSESTIDNHKTRLMRKLHLHKAIELTHVAIREGIIGV
jgi:DNA-binding NarL/FixJ family response regulator